MSKNSQEWLTSQKIRYAREATEYETYLQNSKYEGELALLHARFEGMDHLLSEEQKTNLSHPSPLGHVKEQSDVTPLQPMEKVKLELHKQRLMQEITAKIRHDLRKEMLRKKENDLAHIETLEGKAQFEEFFNMKIEREDLARIETENEAKARIQRQQTEKQGLRISDQFEQPVDKFPQGVVTISHKGQAWEYTGKGDHQSFKIKSTQNEEIVIVEKHLQNKGIDEGRNAIVEAKDFSTRKMVADRNPHDLALSLDIGQSHAARYFEAQEKWRTSRDFSSLYPAYNNLSKGEDGQISKEAKDDDGIDM